MNNKLWKKKWKRNDIGFHQKTINPLFKQWLPQMKLDPKAQVLVPLCGKSHDMDWLADEGYRVLGVELSDIAIAAYFDARKIKPVRVKRGRFMVSQAGNIELWCGDIFDLAGSDLDSIKLLYDCASLTAFPAKQRPNYVKHFHEALPNPSPIMLVTTESPESEGMASVARIDGEVRELYESRYSIELLHSQNSLKIDPAQPNLSRSKLEEKVYLIKNHIGKF